MFFGPPPEASDSGTFGSGLDDDRHLHLSSYVEALTCVLQYSSSSVAPPAAMAIEQVLVHVISTFPRLPKQYHRFSLVALRDVLGRKSRDLMPGLVPGVVYQGVIQSCSYPIVTKTEEELLESVEKIVSVDSFFPLWCGLMEVSQGNELQEIVFNSFMDACLKILDKLDFSIRNDEQEREGEQSDVEMETRANKAKDFTVMANLVKLFGKFVSSSPPSLFEGWMEPVGTRLVELATKFPEVSGFYRLFAACLHAGERSRFFLLRDRRRSPAALRSFSSFLRESLGRCRAFEDELLLSCLVMCLDAPLALAEAAGMDSYAAPLERVFGRYGGRNTALVHRAIGFLEKARRDLGGEKTSSLVRQLIPSMKNFLYVSEVNVREERDDGDGDSERDLASRRKRRGRKKKIDLQIEESDFERAQKRMMLFLGQLEMEVLVTSLLPSREECGAQLTAPSPARSLSFDLPFHDVNVSVTLDDLLPRILHLCRESASRKGRVAACEALHSIVLLIIGR